MFHGVYKPRTVPVEISYAEFQGGSGVDEYEFYLRPIEYGSINQQLDWLENAYKEVQAEKGLALNSCVFRKFFCSDVYNQTPLLQEYSFSNPDNEEPHCAVSLVGQLPELPSKVTLWAQHIHDPNSLKLKQNGSSVELARGELSHHWTTNVTSLSKHSSFRQTNATLAEYEKYLTQNSMNLAENVQRTWFYVRHIDVNYKSFASARRSFFEERGLTPETHFVASTGIEGVSYHHKAKISMDAYAIKGIRPEQTEYIEASEHLGPTHVYGVTFERATAISFQDRKHIYISGTASIDPQGSILHEGDISLQFDRALENVEALLKQTASGLGDMASFIAYVRDPSDVVLVRRKFQERLDSVPVAVVVAPICRPGWLIELEGRAIISVENPSLPQF